MVCPKLTILYANVAIFSLPNGIKDVLFHREGPLSRFQNKGPCLLSIKCFFYCKRRIPIALLYWAKEAFC